MTTPVYKSGTTVGITVALPVYGASVLIPTAISVSFRDETGVLIDTLSPTLPVSPATTVTFGVDGPSNTLGLNVRKGARTIETIFTTVQGTFTETTHYLLEATTQLVLLSNSFMTFPEALMIRSDLPAAPGWDSVTDSTRMAALMIAHWNLCAMVYKYRVGLAGQSRISDFGGVTTDPYGRVFASVSDIRNTAAWEWAEFPDDFKTALKRAQLCEADSLLQGDPVADKRHSGIVSEKIGESAMTFLQVPEARFAVSRAALQYLSGFVVHSHRLSRA